MVSYISDLFAALKGNAIALDETEAALIGAPAGGPQSMIPPAMAMQYAMLDAAKGDSRGQGAWLGYLNHLAPSAGTQVLSDGSVAGASTPLGINFIVPAGEVYQVTVSAGTGTVSFWYEW